MGKHKRLPPLALVIEDDHLMSQLCSRALEGLGLQVICCDTSTKAASVMQLHGHRIVWILADVVLSTPGMRLMGNATAHEGNGARLLPLLTHVCPTAMAVQMSAYSMAELTAMGYKVEVAHFLQKPFTLETLRAMVKKLLPNLSILSEPSRTDFEDVNWVG